MDLDTIIIMLALAAVPVIIGAGIAQRAKHHRHVLSSLTPHFNDGKVVRRWGDIELRFTHRGRPGRLKFDSTRNGLTTTRLTLDCSISTPFELITIEYWSKLNTIFKGQEIRIDSSSLHQTWRLRGAEKAEISPLFSPTVLRHITELDKLKLHDVQLRPSHIQQPVALLALKGWFDATDVLLEFIHTASALVDALEAAYNRHWIAASEATGLTLSKSTAAPLSLRGTIHGLTVSAKHQETDDENFTEVNVRIRGPSGLWVVHRDQPTRSGDTPIDMGHPVLSSTVRVTGNAPDRIRALVSAPAVVEALLPVVHGFPGSTLTATRVHLVVPGRAGPALEEHIELAVNLARAVAAAIADG